MARLAHIVLPGLPHHVTRHGDRGARTFFSDEDFAAFLAEEADGAMNDGLRRAESVGPPLGNPGFLAAIERRTCRVLAPARRGPEPRD